MSKKVSILHFFDHHLAAEPEIITLLGEAVELEHIDCQQNISMVEAILKKLDGKTDAIALSGLPRSLQVGNRTAVWQSTAHLFEMVQKTPVFDGSQVSSAVERWGVRLAHEAEPGIWSNKRVLMVPSINHFGLAEALGHYASKLQSADHFLYAGIDGENEKTWVKGLSQRPLEDLLTPYSDDFQAPKKLADAIEWADILAGDVNVISNMTTANLKNKTIVCPAVSHDVAQELRKKGAAIVVTVLPSLSHDHKKPSRHAAATLEACLAAVAKDGEPSELSENDFLNLISELNWSPSINYLQPDQSAVNRFGYITQPNSVAEIRQKIKVARFLPKAFIDRTAVHIPPVFSGRIENIQGDGKKNSAIAEVMMLGGTPEEFTAQDGELIARRMLRAARLAEQLEARLIGVDTASREVSDALSTIAPKTNVAATSGQALTILGSTSQAVEIAKSNSQIQGEPLQAIVINASDPVASIAAEVLGGHVPVLTLSGNEPDLLIQLKRKIEDIHLNTKVTIVTSANTVIGQHDIILVGRTMAGKRININPQICKPGAVICDYSQPSVITDELLKQRPDITLIESVAYKLPADPVGHGLNQLPVGHVPAPFAEAALLALKGKFADFGLVGQLSSKNVYDIGDLARRHQFVPAGIIAHSKLVPQAEIAKRGELARSFAQAEASSTFETEYDLAVQPDRPSIRRFAREHSSLVVAALGAVAVVAGGLGWVFRRRRNQSDI